MRRSNSGSLEAAEQLMRALIYRDEFSAKIDRRNQMVYFDEKDVILESSSIDAAMHDLVELSELITKFDDAVRLNPIYLARSQKSSGGFNEDEGKKNS